MEGGGRDRRRKRLLSDTVVVSKRLVPRRHCSHSAERRSRLETEPSHLGQQIHPRDGKEEKDRGTVSH